MMDPNDIDDGADYQVALAKPVMRGPFKMLPRDRHTWTGAVLREVTNEHGWEVIAGVERVS